MIIFLIFIFFWLGLSLRYSAIVFIVILLILLAIVFYKFRHKVALICFGVALIGFGITYINIDINKGNSFEGMVIEAKTNYFILLSKGEKLYSYSKDNEYEIGDYLKIKGRKTELSFTMIESQFDFKDYLNKKGIKYELEAEIVSLSFKNPIRIKRGRNKFLSHFSEESRGIISAILFSDGSGETVEIIDQMHLGRLINASGIFIYAFLHFFTFILEFFIKNKKWCFIPLIILLPYIIFTFPRFTVIKIFLLKSFRYINSQFLNKRFNRLETLGIVGLLFLIIDYHLGYQISFVLGFVMPIIVYLIQDALTNKRKMKKRILTLVMIYLAFIPFEIQFYNGINPLSLPLQVILSPLFIVFAVMALITFYGVPLYSVVDVFSKELAKMFGLTKGMVFQINAPPFNEWWILLYTVLLIICLYYQSLQFKPIYRFSYSLLGLFLVLYAIPMQNMISEEVCFINVGQGDACLIRKKNTTILIDTGGLSYVDVAKQSLIPFMQKKRIYNVDLVITTHNDYDHNGALDSLKENFYVKRVITESTSFPITEGGITFTNYNNHIELNKEDNDNSLVVGFNLCKRDFLITGDATKEVENNIMKEYDYIPCDVLKVGHHGSNTSTSDVFVKYLSPNDAVISCGKNNRYGHPKQDVINILKNNGVNIFRTDEQGTIRYFNYISM